ncbi:MAG: 3-(methylthio)propionyl-CoA ligase [Pseudomonadales bacterium]|nr:3-(methylthio)propionyl-CoA ligase [Pseudomonadales bacterium]
MLGNMMNRPLLISDLIEHAARYYPKSEIVSRRCEGDIHRYNYQEAATRAKKLANALNDYGINTGDRIATLAWNNYRHYEIYFGASGAGFVTHTINPRLFPEQIIYIVNHAQDRLLFVDLTFVPLIEKLQDKLACVEKIVILADADNMPETSLTNVICYEDFIGGHSSEFEWPELDENTAAALCYTSGTTGNPKGVLYSHRSTIVHAWASTTPEALGISSSTNLLPVVPMFHVSAWGTPYACTLTGAKLVFPGPGLDGPNLTELIQQEAVDLLLGVPTVWLGLLSHLRETQQVLSSVQNVVIGGSAAPLAMIKEFDDVHGAFVVHAWGMTEMSPIGTIGSMNRELASLSKEARYKYQQKQGRPVFGVQIKIVDDEGQDLPQDGVAFGRLMVRGPWIIERYFQTEETTLENGWFDTGDVATIDEQGYMQIVDRNKDVIKSGGEWISSIELENIAVGHDAVKEACVIGIQHPKWDERPLLLVVLEDGASITHEEMSTFLEDKVAKWWLPNDTVVVNELPHTATGKLLKVKCREEFGNHYLEN